MLFNSVSFFAFLAIVFTVYWLLKKGHKLQNLFILASSYFFYACWDWRFLILIVISSTADFFIGKWIGKCEFDKGRKQLLATSVFLNLALLGFFKYFNFFIEAAELGLKAIGINASHYSLSIMLPVGISFYTFQTLSYTIDVYRRQLKPTENWLEFFAFVSFFPQLVAGPIERASNLLPQFENSRVFDTNLAVRGLRLILWGLFKKMVIADRLAIMVDAIYADPSSCDSVMALMAGVLFAFQVYCDFSGYSDIAIGSARLFGFNLMRNFVTPFQSKSLTELWQRWHISLSSWFKDYLYIPLGGNRTGPLKWTLIVLLTFTVSGLWHGADFHYVVWGFLCGVPLVLEKAMGKRQIGVIPTFTVFSLLLILFRSPDLNAALVIYQQLVAFQFNGLADFSAGFPSMVDANYTLALLGGFVLAEYRLGKIDFDEAISKTPRGLRWSVYYVLLALIMLFGVMNNAPQFIYFQF